jgi:hypothetical protein
MANKLVIAADNFRSTSLKLLAAKLSERLGYRVYRTTPARVRARTPVLFLGGIDKRSQYSAFVSANVSCPAHTDVLANALLFGSKRICVRHLTNASEGRGLEIVEREGCNIQAPLYTEYIPKKREFRVHVWADAVIDVQQKRRRVDHAGERDPHIRNTANGYVFCRDGVVEPDDLRGLALAAVRSLGRSYGAVDVIWNEARNKSYVLEVNSRPGMEGTTLEKYADAILAQVAA